MLRETLRGETDLLQDLSAVDEARPIGDVLVRDGLLRVDGLASKTTHPLDLYLGEEKPI